MDRQGEIAALLRWWIRLSGGRPADVAGRAGIEVYELESYTSAAVLPRSLRTLERIGVACGVTEDELDRMGELWFDLHATEITLDGIVFRSARAGVGTFYAKGDPYSIVLGSAWENAGRLRPVGRPDPRAERVLQEFLVEKLRADAKARATARRALRGSYDDRAFPFSTRDPDVFERRVDAVVAYRTPRPEAVAPTLGLGLAHPVAAIAERAAELIRRDRSPAPALVPGLAALDHIGNRVPAIIQEWSDWANQRGPVDRAVVEKGLRQCYELNGRPWPRTVIWVTSPFAGAFLATVLAGRPLWLTPDHLVDLDNHPPRHDDDLAERIDRELRARVGPDGYVRAHVLVGQPVAARQTIRPDFFDHPGWNPQPHLGPTDPDQLRQELLRCSLSLPRQLRRRLREVIDTAAIRSYRWTERPISFSGQTRASWLATANLVHSAVRDLAPPTLSLRLAAYRDASAAGPWWPTEQYVIVTERPTEVRTEIVDGYPRLHDDGPALTWRDGTVAYVRHGERMPFVQPPSR